MAYTLGSTGSDTSPGTFKQSDHDKFNSKKPLKSIGRGVKTDIYSIPDGSPIPRPINNLTSNEMTALINVQANERSGRNKPNTQGKNIGNDSGGRAR